MKIQKTGTKEVTMEDEIILFILIEGMQDSSHLRKIFERLKITNLKASIELLQLKLIEKFSQQKDYKETFKTTKCTIARCRYAKWTYNVHIYIQRT